MQSSYDSGVEVTIEENLLIKSSAKKPVKVHHACLPLNNDLFSQECAEETTDEGIRLHRKLVMKKATLGPEKLVLILPDIEKLNRIDESYIIEKK